MAGFILRLLNINLMSKERPFLSLILKFGYATCVENISIRTKPQKRLMLINNIPEGSSCILSRKFMQGLPGEPKNIITHLIRKLAITWKKQSDQQTITVYDQLGQTTDLLVTLENTGDSEWNIITSDGGQGTLTFEKPDDAGGETGSIVNIDYDGQYELDLDSIIQVAGKNEIVLSQDGNAKGHLQKDTLSISADGTISAMYDNGLSHDLGQVAVATFDNNAGLTKAGTTTFAASRNSGEARVEEAGSIRSGDIASKALENSNVNLTEELSNMILAQQAFTAGIRMITTGDRLITEVMRMRP